MKPCPDINLGIHLGSHPCQWMSRGRSHLLPILSGIAPSIEAQNLSESGSGSSLAMYYHDCGPGPGVLLTCTNLVRTTISTDANLKITCIQDLERAY
jgi:hypothetical protein